MRLECSNCARFTYSPRLIRSCSLLEIGGRDPAERRASDASRWWRPRRLRLWRRRLSSRPRRSWRCRWRERERVVDLAAREGEFRRLSLAAREKDDRRPPRDLHGEGLVLRELEPREVVPVRLLLLEEPVEEVVLLEVEERTAPTEWRPWCREWRPVPRRTDRRRRRARRRVRSRGGEVSSAAAGEEDRPFLSPARVGLDAAPSEGESESDPCVRLW